MKDLCQENEYLKEAPEGSWRASGGLGRLRGGLTPRHLAIATGAHLATGDNQLKEPQVRVLLPQHKSTHFTIVLRVRAVAALVDVRRHHLHLPHRVHAAQ